MAKGNDYFFQIFCTITYIMFIIAVATNSPVTFVFLIIPATFSSFLFFGLYKNNLKFLKAVNDFFLYLIATIKTFGYAYKDTGYHYVRTVSDLVNNDHFIIGGWVIIMVCTILKATISITEAVSALNEKVT